jgi:hypothetical protein
MIPKCLHAIFWGDEWLKHQISMTYIATIVTQKEIEQQFPIFSSAGFTNFDLSSFSEGCCIEIPSSKRLHNYGKSPIYSWENQL